MEGRGGGPAKTVYVKKKAGCAKQKPPRRLKGAKKGGKQPQRTIAIIIGEGEEG